ncbi:MAG: hypothetical protein J5601_04620 [Elusimicrobiaceae bacterium]|nr:hypothetical protein [Elusimicrobiaceae bacterium]
MEQFSIKKFLTLALVLCWGVCAFAQTKVIVEGWEKAAKEGRKALIEHLRIKNPGVRMGLLEQLADKFLKEIAVKSSEIGTEVSTLMTGVERSAAKAVKDPNLAMTHPVVPNMELDPRMFGSAYQIEEGLFDVSHEANLANLYKQAGILPTSLANKYFTDEDRAVAEGIINDLADSFFYEHGYFPQINGTAEIDGISETRIASEMMLARPIPWREMLDERAEYGNACTKYYQILKGYLFEKGTPLPDISIFFAPKSQITKEELEAKRILAGLQRALKNGNPETREYQLLKKLYDYSLQFPRATGEEPFWGETAVELKTDTPLRDIPLPNPSRRTPILQEDVKQGLELAQERKYSAQWRQQNIDLEKEVAGVAVLERQQISDFDESTAMQEIREYNEWLENVWLKEMKDAYRHLAEIFQEKKNKYSTDGLDGVKAQINYYVNLLETPPSTRIELNDRWLWLSNKGYKKTLDWIDVQEGKEQYVLLEAYRTLQQEIHEFEWSQLGYKVNHPLIELAISEQTYYYFEEKVRNINTNNTDIIELKSQIEHEISLISESSISEQEILNLINERKKLEQEFLDLFKGDPYRINSTMDSLMRKDLYSDCYLEFQNKKSNLREKYLQLKETLENMQEETLENM